MDPTRPATTFKTSWRNVRAQAKVTGRFHDNRHTLITELAERGAGDQTIMDIAGHVSKQMLKHYSHIRMEAKRLAFESIVKNGRSSTVQQKPNGRSQESLQKSLQGLQKTQKSKATNATESVSVPFHSNQSKDQTRNLVNAITRYHQCLRRALKRDPYKSPFSPVILRGIGVLGGFVSLRR